jgi:predicted nucleic acid-binding protein
MVSKIFFDASVMLAIFLERDGNHEAIDMLNQEIQLAIKNKKLHWFLV